MMSSPPSGVSSVASSGGTKLWSCCFCCCLFLTTTFVVETTMLAAAAPKPVACRVCYIDKPPCSALGYPKIIKVFRISLKDFIILLVVISCEALQSVSSLTMEDSLSNPALSRTSTGSLQWSDQAVEHLISQAQSSDERSFTGAIERWSA